MIKILKEFLEVFKEEYNKNPDIVLDNYIPKDGRYVVVQMNKDKDWEIISDIEIKYDRKNNKFISGSMEKYFKLIKKLDYNSKIIDMNKPMDPKKTIHSSNYLSLFFKKENYESKLNNAAIDRYYDQFNDLKEKYKKKYDKELYLNTIEKLEDIDKDEVNNISTWLKENIYSLNIDKNKKREYFKIFFIYEDLDKTIEKYKLEQYRYGAMSVFSDNSHNTNIEGKIYGIPNNTITLNNKKPYLGNLDSNRISPTLLDIDDVIMQNLSLDYLNELINSKSIYKIYIDTEKNKISFDNKPKNGIELRFTKGKNTAIITNYKKIINYNDDIDITINKYISEKYLNSLKKKNDVNEIYRKYIKRYDFIKLINFRIFENSIIKNENNLDKLDGIKKTKLKNMVLKYGNSLLEWKNYNKTENFKKNIENIMIESIEHNIGLKEKYSYYNAVNQFNIGMSLLEYFNLIKGDELMNIRESLKEKVLNSKESYTFENDDEALYAAGQIINYVLSKSSSKTKDMDFMRDVLNKKDNDKIIESVVKIITKYKHLLEIADTRSSLLISSLLQHEFINKGTDKKYLIAGFLDSQIIYTKNEENKGEDKQ